ncbi:hypothetical protein [Candidatus Aquicultor sp.]
MQKLLLHAPGGDGITVNAATVTVSSLEASNVSLLTLGHDINGNGVIDTGETLAQTTSAAGVAGFTGFNLPISPSTTETVLVKVELSASAVVGHSVQTSLTSGDIGVAGPDTAASFGTIAGALMTISDFPDVVALSTASLGAGSLARAQADAPMQQIDLSLGAGYDAATVDTITVSKVGSAPDTDVAQVKLWQDTGNGSFGAEDTLLGGGTFSAGSITFGALNAAVTQTGPRRLFVSYSISATAGVGDTLGSSVSGALALSPDTVDTSGAAPSALQQVSLATEELSVSQASVADTATAQGQGSVVQKLLLHAPGGDNIILSGANIGVATTPGSNVSLVKLAHDINHNDVIDTGETFASTMTAVGTASFSGLNMTIASNTTETVLVGVDLSYSATPGATVITSLNSASGGIQVADPDKVAGFGIISGATVSINDFADTIALRTTTPATGPVSRASQDNLIERIDLSFDNPNYDAATLNSITIHRTGTGVDSDVSQVKLWLDDNQNGSLDTTDTSLGSGTFTGTNITFSSLNVAVGQGQPKRLLVTYSIASTATTGATLGADVTAAGAVPFDTVSLIAPTASNLQQVGYSADTLTVSGSSISNTTTAQGTADVTGQKILLHASPGDDITVTAFNVGVATTPGSNVSLVKLAHDINHNDVIDTGETFASTMTAGGVAQFTTNFKVASNTTETVLVGFDISYLAGVNATIQSSIAYAPDASSGVVVANPDQTNVFGSFTGSTITVSDYMDVISLQTSSPGTATVARASSDNLIETIDLSLGANYDAATLNSITVSRTGTGADTDVSQVKLWLDSNNDTTLTAADATIATGIFSGGALTLNPSVSVVQGTPKRLFVTYSITSAATPQATLGADITAAGAMAPDTVNRIQPTASNLQQISYSSEYLQVSGGSIPATTSAQGSLDVVGQKILLHAPNGDGVTVTAANVTITTPLSSNILLVKLAHDTNGNNRIDTGETIGSTTTAAGMAQFSNLALNITPNTTETLLVGYNLSYSAGIGQTIQSTISFISNGVQVDQPDHVDDFGIIYGALVTISDAPDVISLRTSSPATATVSRSSQDNVMQAINLSLDSLNYDAATLSTVTVQRTGGADSDVSQVKLWLDSNNDATLTAADTQIGTGTLSGGSITFPVSIGVAQGQTKRLFVTYSISPTANIGAMLGSNITTATAVSPDGVALIPPTASNSQQVIYATETLQVSHSSVATATVEQGSTNVLAEKINLHDPAGGDGVNVNTITLRQNGSAPPSDITLVKLFVDSNNNGLFEPALDTETMSSPLTGQSVTFSNLNIAVSVDSTKTVFAVFNLSTTASINKTLQSNIVYNPDMALSDIKVDSPDLVGDFGALNGTTITVSDKADTLNVTQLPVSSGQISRASNNNLIQTFDLSVDNDSSTVSQITLSKASTTTPQASFATDIKSGGIKLWLESNGDSTFTATGDTLIATATVASEQAVFSNLSNYLDVKDPAHKRLYVTMDISPTAQTGVNIGTSLDTTSSVVISSPDTVSAAAPLVSTLRMIGYSRDKLTVSNISLPNIDAQQSTTNTPGQELALHADPGDGVSLTGINVALTGVQDSDINAVKLIWDKNSNGVYDSSTDTVLVSTSTSSGMMARFTIPGGLFINPDSTETVLVAYDISVTAKVGAIINSNAIYSTDTAQSGVQVADPDYTNSFGNLSGASIRITDLPDTLVVKQTPVDGGNVVVGTSNHVMQVLDISVPQDMVTLTTLSVNLAGTATSSDTAANGVKLWYDADNSNSITLADWQLSSSKTFIGGRVTFDNIKLAPISPSSPKKLLVTYSISSTANIGVTIGASVDSTSSVGVAPPDIVSLQSLSGPVPSLASVLHTIAPSSPNAPTGLVVTAGANRQYTLDWNTNPASEHVAEYDIYRSDSETGSYSPVGTTTPTQPHFVNVVPAAADYWYKVSAKNVTGESVKSAGATATKVDVTVTIDTTGTTTTIESANAAVKLIIPPSSTYLGKTFTIRSAPKPSGVKVVSRFYYDFSTTATQPFNPALMLVLRCDSSLTSMKDIAIYHYTSLGKWEQADGGRYFFSADSTVAVSNMTASDIGYTNITSFSGYAAAQVFFGGYNYPLQYTDTATAGPHGNYTSTTNKCKECHAVHLATGTYDLSRVNARNDTCDFCHGIGGVASKQVILDQNGHGADPGQAEVVAPGDTDIPYSKNAKSWGCLECHSAHDKQITQLAGLSSDKLLKADPNPLKNKDYLYYTPVVGETTQTMSQWCSTCHNADFGPSTDLKTVRFGSKTGRVAGHSSSSQGSTTTPDGYADVKFNGTGPTCKQCHPADGRIGASEFPHSSGSVPGMVRSGTTQRGMDGVCTSCHNTVTLP